MRKVTKNYDVYSFEELSEKAKQTAIDQEIKDRQSDSLYSDLTDEFITEELKLANMPVSDVRWRISSSQGDGLAFYGKIQDVLKLAPGLKNFFAAHDIVFKIEKVGPHLYDHYNTMQVTCEIDGRGLEFSSAFASSDLYKITAAKDRLEELVKEVSQKIYKKAIENYEGYFEPSFIEEDLKDGDHEYLENGKRFFE